MPELWRVTPGQHLAHRGWQDEFVVYNNLTGDTHLIDGDTLALLMQLRAGSATVTGLALALGADLPPDDLSALPDTLRAMLDSLHHLHLAVPC